MTTTSELIKILIGAIIIVFLICLACIPNEEKHIRYMGIYEIVEMEDGHQYMKSGRFNRTAEHYVECPKCNNK